MSMKNLIGLLLLFTLVSTQTMFSSNIARAGDDLGVHLKDQDFGGLKKILSDRYIRILTTRNSFDYYIYQGAHKGIQYEMAKEFSKQLNEKYTSSKKKQLPIVFEMVPVDYDQLIPMLKAGKGDLIAAGLTATPKRQKKIAFSKPYRYVDEVVVTHMGNDTNTWRGKTYSVRKSSSYYESLLPHKKQLRISVVDDSLHTENILELVALQKFDYTVVDSYLAEHAVQAFDELKIIKENPFGKQLPIAWAVRKKDTELLRELNAFMPKVRKGSLLGNIFSKKYFSDIGRIKSDDFDLKTSTLSPYDHLFKKYGKKYGFDWRLLAAICYQESRFKQGIVNRWGAIGLFQIKQMTANEPYINIPNTKGAKNAENNIHAGVKYLSWIKKRYFDPISSLDENARIRMTLAAYNAGPARIIRARKKAIEMDLNPNEWFRQVELATLRLGYAEPVKYVSQINKNYVSYLLLGIK